MKNFTPIFILLTFVLLIITSCNSDQNDPATPIPSASAGFKWKENSTTATEKTAASADFKTNTMRAYDANQKMIFEINLMKSSAVGTYTIDGDYVKGTALYYLEDSFNATSGTFTITSNTNGKMSGTFEAHGSGNTISTMYGTFTDIPIQ